jgi:hypothetical protein
MFRKKWVLWLSIVVCLVMWGTLSSAAESSDDLSLINLLKEKNIITQQEADELMKKIKASTAKERTEIREELKTAAKKGDFLPAALQGIKFGTTIFAEWNNYNPSDQSKQESTNKFLLNRAYFTFTKDINEWLSVNLTTDVTYTEDTGYKDGKEYSKKSYGWEARQKYAYAALKSFGTTTELGLGHTPSDDYDGSIWPYRVQGKHLLDDLGIQSSADFGINNSAKFKYGGYRIGVYNGAGYDTSEHNQNKVASGLVYLRPLPDVSVLKGLQIAYSGTYGDSNEKFKEGDTGDYPEFKAHVCQVSLQHELFTIMGQNYWGSGAKASTEDFDREAYLVEGFARIPTIEKARIFGRYQHYDPDTDKDDNGWDKFVVGLSYDLTKEFMPFIAFESRSCDDRVDQSKTPEYAQVQVGFQLKF